MERLQNGAVAMISEKLLKFNISGQSFLISQSLFSSEPESHFLSEKFLSPNWNDSLEAYYFNRDPALFNVVLNIFRYGKVNLPSGYDEEMLNEELNFWNISKKKEPSTGQDEGPDLEEEFLWMEGRIPPPAEGASMYTRGRFKMWCFMTDPIGPHTPGTRAALLYAVFSILMTFLFLTVYGFSTSSFYRDLKYQSFNLSDCETRLQCFVITTPKLWMKYLIRSLLVYFCLETVLKLICCTHHRLYFTSLINWIDLLADICAILGFVFASLADRERNVTYSVLEIVFQGLQVFRIFRIFQVCDVFRVNSSENFA